jgi:hypothetical protein
MPTPFEDNDTWEELSPWPPCPDGNAQSIRHPLGFRERNECELELRVVLGGDDLGVCQVIVDEGPDEVGVRVLVCYDDSDEEPCGRDHLDWPVRVWLDQPLGDRAVIDAERDEELALFIPSYLDNIPQPDADYHRVNRRRR